jgi:hypothetical protein
MEDEKQCILVIIGTTPEGRKDLVGFQAGFRESAQSWRELLEGLKGRGLSIGPNLAVGDGALGFWKALDASFPGARHQRCWVHKTANALNKLPKARQKAAKDDLHAIWMADGRAEAEKAMDTFAAKYDAKYPQAVTCLTKDRGPHCWPSTIFRQSIGCTSEPPIPSRACSPRSGTAPCAAKDACRTRPPWRWFSASKSWRRLKGNNQLPKVIEGVRFRDGIQVPENETNAAA